MKTIEANAVYSPDVRVKLEAAIRQAMTPVRDPKAMPQAAERMDRMTGPGTQQWAAVR